MEDNIKVGITVDENTSMPEYKTVGSSGMDIRANENLVINPLGRASVRTGLYLEIPEGYEAQVRPRSGLAIKHGVTVLNTPGTIDSDYRGEIMVILINLGSFPFLVDRGDRIAQVVFVKVERAEFMTKETLQETERGSGGFGSTGVK